MTGFIPRLGRFASAADDFDHEVRLLEQVSALKAVRDYKAAAIARLGLSPGDHVLDAGCGAGHDLSALAACVGPSGKVCGIDSSPLMVKHAIAAGGPSVVQVSLGKIYALPFADQCFHAARADRVLHQVDVPAQGVRELMRVVRLGGRVVVSEPDLRSLALDLTDGFTTARLLEFYRRQLLTQTDGRSLRRLFVHAGLREVEIDARTVVLTELDLADRLLGLGQVVQMASVSGVITEYEALRWRDRAARDSEEETFMASMTVITASGSRVWSRDVQSHDL